MYCTNFNFLHEAAKKTASFMICFPLLVILLKNKLQGTDKLKLF